MKWVRRNLFLVLGGLLALVFFTVNVTVYNLHAQFLHGSSMRLTKDSFVRQRENRLFLKFDEAAPRSLPEMARSHGLPNAIPTRRVIPRDRAEDEDYHIQRRTDTKTKSIIGEKRNRPPFFGDDPMGGKYNWNHSYADDHRALYLYNPSILPLQWDSDDPDRLTDADLKSLTGGDPAVAYLAIYRTNTGGNCFGPDKQKVMKTGEQISYLAVALLDRNLDLISGTDVLIDLNAGPSFGKYFRQFTEDCKLANMRRSIYFLCNERIFHVKISRTGQNTEVGQFHTNRDFETPYLYPNIYGSGLQIVLFSQTKIAGGKNLNIFRYPSTSSKARSYDYYLQNYPLPHTYNRLQVPSPGDKTLIKAEASQKSTGAIPLPSFDGPDTANTIITCPENEQEGGSWVTNCTNPKVNPFFGDDDHGTACCLSLSLGKQGTVMVGITHTKTSLVLNPWWRRDIRGQYNDKIGGKRYLSRFVAYKTEPPFDIVARSGWFCLGFAQVNEAGGNTLAGYNEQYALDLFDGTYGCPMIHFASGLSEFVGNSSRAVISYGVSDCYPRMIVVDKEEIAKLLLGKR